MLQVPMYLYGVSVCGRRSNLAEPTVSFDLHWFCIATLGIRDMTFDTNAVL